LPDVSRQTLHRVGGSRVTPEAINLSVVR